MHHANPTATKSKRRPLGFMLLALLSAFFVLFSACSPGNDDDAAVSMDAPADDMAAPESAMATDDSGGPVSEQAADEESALARPEPVELSEDSGLAVPTALTPADLGRDIIYRATIEVQADDVAAANREAVAIVQGLGGIVFSQSTRTEPRPRTEITFKVLPGDFSTALERLAGVGKLIDQVISSDDVTEIIVDLESRIITAEASVTRLRKFLEEATQLEDVAQLERELLDRETTLERLRGQLRTLSDQVDLATITLTITQSPTVLPDTGIRVTAWVSEDAQDPCLGVQNITVEPDASVYLCLEVENTGTSALTDVDVSTRNLRLNLDNFRPVQGNFNRIEANELMAAVLELPIEEGRLAGRVATRGLPIELEVLATPVDFDGTALDEVWGESVVWVQVDTDDALPGFGDSVSDGASGVVAVFSVVLIVVGVLLPFLPIIAALAALIWWIRSRRNRKAESPPPAS
ncbi:MAG: DUF4349 domain-containing protein [Acidimicrobiia bacterium]|nr:DUF4349 domain-containing protein [Acidimicrobiia bacterium]MCY4432750.1 DUF4349 domain-containing protein [bacterium]